MMCAENTTVVLGPAGCGKTHRLLDVVEKAMAEGVPPDRICFASFTKKATEEARARASARFSLPEEDFPHFRTLHSFAFKHLSMRRDQVFGWRHLKELGKMLGIEFKENRGMVDDEEIYGMAAADRMLFLDGLARNKLQPLNEAWKEAMEDEVDWRELDRFSRALESFKKSRMLFDFTDMMQKFVSSTPSTLPKFDLLLVDEVQDTSALQWKAIRMIAGNSKQVYVGGDDCQCIYSWSGADVDQFIDLPGRQETLEQSYRVPRKVAGLANSISDKVAHKRKRSWKSRAEEGKVNWYSSFDEVDMAKGTWLVLARNGYMLTELEDYCMSQGFSFHSVNRDPLKSHSLVAIRTWENLRKGLEESSEKVLDCLKYVHARFVPLALLQKLKADEPGQARGMSELKALGLGTDQIWHSALGKISPAERDFFIAARKRGEPLLKEPRIRISTIHSAKGSEADHVLLLTDISNRCFQNMQERPDDEHRVFYVATTRCKETLNIVTPRTNIYYEI